MSGASSSASSSSIRRGWVAPAAARKWAPRKNSLGCPPTPPTAEAPPSSISCAKALLTEQVGGGGPELVREDAPDLAVVGRFALAREVVTHRPLVLPALAGDGLLRDLVAR